ncbi:hypothetical protein B0H14DRAFT_3094589 [Mycena olivaceomarginata]|nr:hypothetical protein B0H14DRAFT_3094589 [Mycena olivaceomarginata]
MDTEMVEKISRSVGSYFEPGQPRGANTGLGYEIVKTLYATSIPYELVIGSRTLSKADDAIKVLQPEVDVSSDASLEAAVKTLYGRYGRLDIIINNVGAGFDAADTNVSGTHVLITLAVPFLLKSADPRRLFITSGTSSIAETDPATPPPKGWPKPQKFVPFPSYRSAKVGLNMLMREWVRTLKEDGVKVWAISPGFFGDWLLKIRALEPHIGGEFVRDVVEGKRDHDMGKAIRSNMVQPW